MKKHKVILVDDHQMLIDGLSAILAANENIEILKTFTNGNLLLEELHELQPEIILTDISMPDIDGYELTKNQTTKSVNTSNRTFYVRQYCRY